MPSGTSRLTHFRREGGFFFPGPRTRVRVTGADRLRYLNGQLSNDLRRLVPGEAIAALILTAKGKLCADLFVWIDGDALIVEADASLEDSLPARLERYAVADDVAFELMPQDPHRCHVFGSLPAGEGSVRVRRLGVQGLDLSNVPENLMEAGSDEIELLRIERGIPRWGNELSEDTLPQEAGLDEIAVDFKKGCYVGQEVVSRMEHRGTARNRIVPVAAEGSAPDAGLPVMAGDKQVGLTGSAAGSQGLAMLRLDRVADAQAAGTRLTAGGVTIHPRKPDWARFPFPGDKAAE